MTGFKLFTAGFRSNNSFNSAISTALVSIDPQSYPCGCLGLPMVMDPQPPPTGGLYHIIFQM